MTVPLVSIIIPVYNAENYLAATIESAMDQTWPNKEILIIDDGSTDGSLAIARRYESSTVSVYQQPNKGASAARNTGLLAAKGDFVQFLDADDLLSANKIVSQVTLLQQNPGKLAVCSTIHFKDGDDAFNARPAAYEDSFLFDTDDPAEFLINLYGGHQNRGAMVTVHAWLTPATVIQKAGKWNEDITVDDDGEFFCRAVLSSNGIVYAKDCFSYYRKFAHSSSLSGNKREKDLKSIVAAIDLKTSYVLAKTNNEFFSRIFAKHYWWTGVTAYPQYKSLSNYCINKARQLGYQGEKYVGGKNGHIISKFFGWKFTRQMVYLRGRLKK